MEAWRQRVRGGHLRKIGLVWGGNAAYKNERRRGISLEMFAPLKELTDTAAILENLDLIITVDTMVAHLAGALARPVWTLLSFAPDWRWMLHRSDSPWYPTMRLFRQPRAGDWESVIEEARTELMAGNSSR